MPLSDYAHWNEDAERMWWEEEGKHIEEPPEPDDYDEMYADREREDPNPGEEADHETVLRAVWDRLAGQGAAFNSMNLHSARPTLKSGVGWITIEDPFGDGNAFLEVTVEVTIEGKAECH